MNALATHGLAVGTFTPEMEIFAAVAEAQGTLVGLKDMKTERGLKKLLSPLRQ
jgi:hypothetical protein